jgi:hypothetical protein
MDLLKHMCFSRSHVLKLAYGIFDDLIHALKTMREDKVEGLSSWVLMGIAGGNEQGSGSKG